jgi:hypothetical protein
VVDGSLKPYRSFRKYTDEEIRSEQDEYFDNDYTKNAVPGLFKDRDDITRWIKDSRLELLDINELRNLKNSDVPEILSYDTKRERLAMSVKLMKHYGKDYVRLLQGFKMLEKLPPPLVIRDKNNNLWLMSGNSRLMVGVSLGYNVPVKIAKYSQEIQQEGFKMKKSELLDVAKQLVKMHGLRSKVVIEKSNNKGDYEWVSDTISIDPYIDNVQDFIESVLHEIDHAKMRKKLGSDKYEQAYTRAGQIMVDKGKDFYWDNPFEKQAEKYAERNVKKYIKKLNFN